MMSLKEFIYAMLGKPMPDDTNFQIGDDVVVNPAALIRGLRFPLDYQMSHGEYKTLKVQEIGVTGDRRKYLVFANCPNCGLGVKCVGHYIFTTDGTACFKIVHWIGK